MIISSTVPPQFVDWNIVDYLTVRFSYLTAAGWRAWVAQGHVQRNGVVCTPETMVTRGDLVACKLPEWEQPDANLDYQIIYEDEWMLGINKPPNLRVHSGGLFLKMNLMFQLREHHDPPYPNTDLINRLDAYTSGLVLVGKDRSFIKEMGALFADKQVQKGYTAVVHGLPPEQSGVIDQPIGLVDGSKMRYWVDDNTLPLSKIRDARTRYAVIESFGDRYATVELWPETGRTHQLRVHMAALGHPLIGDLLYLTHNDDEAFVFWRENPSEAPDVTLISRQALHCGWNEFVHPRTGELLRLEAPLWPDMVALQDQLRL
jgi:23S rRNA pseudouridine1911/1915/1917 synthase